MKDPIFWGWLGGLLVLWLLKRFADWLRSRK